MGLMHKGRIRTREEGGAGGSGAATFLPPDHPSADQASTQAPSMLPAHDGDGARQGWRNGLPGGTIALRHSARARGFSAPWTTSDNH